MRRRGCHSQLGEAREAAVAEIAAGPPCGYP